MMRITLIGASRPAVSCRDEVESRVLKTLQENLLPQEPFEKSPRSGRFARANIES
jgi:hypothetical protein